MKRITVLKTKVDYTLNCQEWENCRKFAEEQLKLSSELYIARGSTSKNKILQDITTGKASEVASYNILKEYINDLSPVDFNVYQGDDRSYDADLKSPKVNIHVKSTTNLLDPSWLFSKKDPIIQQLPDQFDDKIEVASLCVVHSEYPINWKLFPPKISLRYLVNLKNYNKVLKNKKEDWNTPYSPKQAKYKVAIYANKLDKLLE